MNPAVQDLKFPSTITLNDIVNYARSFPELNPILPVGGYNQEPALSFANDVFQKILAQGQTWRWNSDFVPMFLSNALQQDYVTNITDMGWLTQAFRIDINNNTNLGNLNPKPLFMCETTRDLGLTPYQGNPAEVSWIPNTQAVFQQWAPNTIYTCGYGLAGAPANPIFQIIDANNNMLFLDTSIMNLNAFVPGWNGVTLPIPVPNPFNSTGAIQGTSGTVAPVLPPGSLPGTTVQDGTLTWTVANPKGQAIRVNPLPAFGGFVWLFFIMYQRRAAKFTTLQQTLAPIPDDLAYLFRDGFIAKCKQHANTKDAGQAFEIWLAQIDQAVRAGDREQRLFSWIPDSGMAGYSLLGPIYPSGPASPYSYGYGFYGW